MPSAKQWNEMNFKPLLQYIIWGLQNGRNQQLRISLHFHVVLTLIAWIDDSKLSHWARFKGWQQKGPLTLSLTYLYIRVAPMRVKILNQPGSLTESCSFLCGFRNWFQILGCPQELRATAPRSWACTQWASSPWRHYQMNLKLKFYYVNLLYWVKKYLTKNLICY